MTRQRAARIAWAVAPYVGLVLVAWRQQSLERAVAHFVATGQRVMDAAAAQLADKAADLHEQAVDTSARQN